MTDPPESSHAEQHGPFRHLSEPECLDLLSTTTVGRVAFVDVDGQQLIPLNFAVIDGQVYFRTAPDSVLAGLARGHEDVAFGVDYHAPVYRDGWNVTVKGTSSEVTDPALHAQVMSWPRLSPWAVGTRSVVIHLDRRSVAGRWVHGT